MHLKKNIQNTNFIRLMNPKTYSHLVKRITLVKKQLSDECYFEDKDHLLRGPNYIISDIVMKVERKLIPMLIEKLPSTQEEQDIVIRDYLISEATLDYISKLNLLKNER